MFIWVNISILLSSLNASMMNCILSAQLPETTRKAERPSSLASTYCMLRTPYTFSLKLPKHLGNILHQLWSGGEETDVHKSQITCSRSYKGVKGNQHLIPGLSDSRTCPGSSTPVVSWKQSLNIENLPPNQTCVT